MDALQELAAAGGQLGQFFTPAYVAQARAYAVPLRYEGMFDLGLWAVEYALIFGLALHLRLHRACERLAGRLVARLRPGGLADRLRAAFERVWNGPGLGAAVLFVAAMELAWTLVGLPESIYFDFIREHAQGLSHYTAAAYAWDLLKGQLMNQLGMTALVVGLYGMMRRLPRAWAPVLAVTCAAAMLVSGALDPLRNEVFYSYKPLPDGPARQAIVGVLQKGHVAFQNVVVEDMSRATAKGDAFFAGQGPTRLIVVGDTLLGRYTPRELATVVAHEMGHLREPVWTPRIAAALALLLAILAIPFILRTCAARGWFGLRAPDDVVGYVLLMFLMALGPMFLEPWSNLRSRNRESAADAYALELTRDPQSFMTMMAKLTAQNRGDPDPWAWWEAWHWDHPAPLRRIAAALRWAHAHQVALQLPPPQDAAALPATAAASRP